MDVMSATLRRCYPIEDQSVSTLRTVTQIIQMECRKVRRVYQKTLYKAVNYLAFPTIFDRKPRLKFAIILLPILLALKA